MTPEEYERIKEAEKEHLRKLKKLKEVHRQLQRQQKVTKAVTDMTSSMQEKLDVHADMMDRIVTESAISEARLEMAIEASELKNEATQSLEDELELTKAKARDLIKRLKEDQASSGGGESSALKAPRTGESDERKSAPATKSAEHEKKPATSPASKSPAEQLPEKTIGRMKH